MANQDDDMELLRKWRAGDRRAGDVLIRRHYAHALGIARRRLGNEDAAVEATQEAMKVLVQKQDVVVDDFRAYLGKVVFFTVLTQSKRGGKHQPHDPLEGDEPQPGPAPRGAATVMAHKEEEKLMIKALRSLSIDDQLVFYYEFVSDKKRTEIAELIGVSPKQVYKRVNKAKERLRKRLEEFRDSPVRQSTLGGLDTWLKSMHAKSPDVDADDEDDERND